MHAYTQIFYKRLFDVGKHSLSEYLDGDKENYCADCSIKGNVCLWGLI